MSVQPDERYKLVKPEFNTHINGGAEPKGFNYNGTLIEWESVCVAHENADSDDVYIEDGTTYVHTRIIDEMRSGDNKQFHKLPTTTKEE